MYFYNITEGMSVEHRTQTTVDQYTRQSRLRGYRHITVLNLGKDMFGAVVKQKLTILRPCQLRGDIGFGHVIGRRSCKYRYGPPIRNTYRITRICERMRLRIVGSLCEYINSVFLLSYFH